MSNEENLDKQNEQIPAEEEQQTAAQVTSPAEPAEPRTEQQPEAEEHPQAEEQPQTEEQPQAEEEEVLTPAGKVKREKPARTRPPKAEKAPLTKEQKSKNIKLFKLVYYPVLAVFVLLMLAFSIVDGVYGYSRAPQNDAYFDAVNAHIVKLSDVTRSSMAPSDKSGASGLELAAGYITDTLEKGGFYVQEEKKTDPEDEDEAVVTVTDWHKTASGVKDPTVTYHTAVSSAELQNKMGTPHFLAGLELTNIVVGIPSEAENAPAVVVTVRYDSRTDTVGAAENAAFVANVMQTLIDTVKSGAKFQNDIIVVFTEDLDYSYGAYAFFDSFNGFDNVASRAKYGVNLDAYGNGGTLAVTDVSGAGFDYINAVAGVSGTAFNSSIVCDTLPEALKVNGAVKAFGDVPAVQVASVGSLDNAQSAFDTAGELSQAIVAQQASFIKQYIEEFGNSGDTFDAENDGKIAMFSYFEGTVAYTSVASYVIGALLLLLIGGAVAAMIFYKDPKEKELDRGGEKAFSVKRSFLGMAAQLMVIAGTLVTMFAAYFLITLMLTGFGVLPIHAITTVRYFNAGILIAAMILSSAAAFGFTNLFRKLFNVKEPDMLRGSAFLFGFADRKSVV